MDFGENETPATLAAAVLVAYLGHHTIGAEDLPPLARKLREAFTEDARGQPNEVDLALQPLEDVREPPQSSSPTRPIAQPAQVEVSAISRPPPAVRIEDSVMDDHLVSLEDGKHYRSLRRHLMAKYGMTPDDYRAKWKLPPDYPMVAPSYARDRSAVAKRSGLGLTTAQKSTAKSKRA